ncbi:MAG: hypothetical protein KKA42_04835 [candidate division Zixibacteria bacterium]|nr:hypothetical protein [candidate division Zixibacteria bacterium]
MRKMTSVLRQLLPVLTGVVLTAGLCSQARAELRSINPIEVIERDYTDGNLSFDEKARLELLAIHRPDELRQTYQALSAATEFLPVRCATPIIWEIKDRWAELSDETRALYVALATRPVRQTGIISPSGFFRLHYDTVDIHAVPLGDSNGNGTPDYIDNCAAYLDTSLDSHLTLGYILPPGDGTAGGDSLYDVYFSEIMSYGITYPDGAGPESWNDAISYMVMNNNFIGFPDNDDPEGDIQGSAKVTAAHEFHHAVQISYEAGQGIWYAELDATHIEDLIFDQVNDNYNYLNSFMSRPAQSLMRRGNLHEYGAFVWGLYVSQRFDTSLMRAAWEGSRFSGDVLGSLSDTLMSRYGWTLDSAFAEFCTWNYMVALRDDGLHYEEAWYYPSPPIGAVHSAFPIVDRLSPDEPEGYGCCYSLFQIGSRTGTFRIEFDGDDSREWMAEVVLSENLTTHHTISMTIQPGTGEGFLDIPDIELYETVALVGVNTSEYDTVGANYRYSMYSVSDYGVELSVVTTENRIYSGSSRDFEFLVTNPSEDGDVYDLVYWDDSGWVPLDTFDMYIGGENSRVHSVTVHPPPGTSVGVVSAVYCKAASRNDTLVVDSVQTTATTILQYGDVTFDGGVDVGDLTGLISYLFIQGSEPLPTEESGNFDCEGVVDVGDLTDLISYLFISFVNSPCNPL